MANEFPKNKIDLPTVGRIVHVFVTNSEPVQPQAAIVACVPNEGRPLTIHACVFSAIGWPTSTRGIPHKSQAAEHGEMYWDWMDYQKGQAAKTEELQRDLEAVYAVGSAMRPPLPLDNELSRTQAELDHRTTQTKVISSGKIPLDTAEELHEEAVRRTAARLADPRSQP